MWIIIINYSLLTINYIVLKLIISMRMEDRQANGATSLTNLHFASVPHSLPLALLLVGWVIETHTHSVEADGVWEDDWLE